ncbi:NrdJb [Xanthomonas rydalmerensis]|uniref:ribonucleoside-diphosphate reductase n=1 Tax=Xanthomonas rydalmerensis TaxID=3046274 RepID=A0ABZ0JNL2_9XANT|nr:NrdJb [Xanthomonas sp. DM-2023]WOS41404.1 NrdJb [Xanthomonas sp. DM-2023]WOS45589.1 NrdJb [Xanthomonas sp. DM-2023]WOS49768.1 NrdJb [Xanthomonas sp. DM-2023]WOS53948.1 NrdJb [Xanthomonas sp. DM-2023]WOS58131.1 NrdJb [Xanthomonas sp. DM-2023]
MAIKIDQKIKGYAVVTPEDKARDAAAAMPASSIDRATAEAEAPADNIIHMHERIERPDVLIGSTYKIKSPLVEHAMYVTLNDIVLNASTEHELRRPFEIFVNSKSMEHFQWIVALTRIMSAVFRKGGDVTFLVDEMKAVFDPKGGYFKAGGVYMPSLVAELGSIVEEHMKSIGLLHDPEMSDHQRALIAEKRKQYEERSKKNSDVKPAVPSPAGEGARRADEGAAAANSTADHEEDIAVTGDGASFPPSATMCHKCNTKALVIMDGCATCLNCGYSKCG